MAEADFNSEAYEEYLKNDSGPVCECGLIHDPTTYPEWNTARHAEALDAKREREEEAARIRGHRQFMRAAQYGAPERYRF